MNLGICGGLGTNPPQMPRDASTCFFLLVCPIILGNIFYSQFTNEKTSLIL